MRDFLSDPGRQLHGLVFRGEFHFSENQTFVFAEETIDFPDLARIRDLGAGLFNERLERQSVEQNGPFIGRDGVLELGASSPLIACASRAQLSEITKNFRSISKAILGSPIFSFLRVVRRPAPTVRFCLPRPASRRSRWQCVRALRPREK